MLERKTTSLKIDPEIWKMGKKKCIDKDVSISEYIESLIKKDIKLVIFFILFISFLVFGAAFSEKVEAQDNASLNYVWNESCATNDALCWIPWFSTALGEPKIYMDLLNITAENASLVDSLLVDYIFPETQTFTYIDNITVLKDLRVLGNSYLGSFNIESDLIIGNNNLSSTYLGLNTLSPQSLLHLNLSESANSTLSNILTFERSNSSDPLQDNTGFSLLFQHIDDAGEVENISMISSIFTDVSNGSERSALSFYTGYGDGNGIISNLSSSEALRINANLSTTIFGDLAVLGNSYLGTLTFTDNGTFPDSILTDFIYPESNGVIEFPGLINFIGNVSFLDNLTVDGDTFYVDASSNRVGIGTTSPSALLDVAGNQALGSAIAVNLSGVLYINESKVGIGTAAPVDAFVISKDLGADTTGYWMQLENTNTSEGNWGDWRIGHNGDDLGFFGGSGIANPTSQYVTFKYGGNVGIGTTSPADLLVVQGPNKENVTLSPSGNNAKILMDFINGNDAIISFREDSTERGRIAYVGDSNELRLISSEAESILTLHSNNTERIRINAAGNVGIGTTSPVKLLHLQNMVAATDVATAQVLKISSGPSAATGIAGGIGFYTASSGQNNALGFVGVEKTSDTGAHTADLVFYTRAGTTDVAPTEKIRITSGGDLCDQATDADLTDCASDAKLKTNIQNYQYGLNEILQLRPVQFNWNQKAVSELNYNPNITNTGLIAQEVEQIIPEWIDTNSEGYKKIPGSGNLDLVLVNAVKELNSKISALEQQNNELKAEISALKEPSLEKNPREKKK